MNMIFYPVNPYVYAIRFIYQLPNISVHTF